MSERQTFIYQVFHPITDITTFYTAIDQLFPKDVTSMLKEMRYALEYDNSTFFINLKHNKPLLDPIYSLLWHDIPYIHVCYTCKAFNICIEYLLVMYATEDTSSFLIQFSLDLMSQLLVKCLYSDQENLANKMINDLFKKYELMSLGLFYEMWECNKDLRCFTIAVNGSSGKIGIQSISSADRTYTIHQELDNPLKFLSPYKL